MTLAFFKFWNIGRSTFARSKFWPPPMRPHGRFAHCSCKNAAWTLDLGLSEVDGSCCIFTLAVRQPPVLASCIEIYYSLDFIEMVTFLACNASIKLPILNPSRVRGRLLRYSLGSKLLPVKNYCCLSFCLFILNPSRVRGRLLRYSLGSNLLPLKNYFSLSFCLFLPRGASKSKIKN